MRSDPFKEGKLTTSSKSKKLRKYKDQYDAEGRDKNTIKLKNFDEDIAEAKISIKTHQEFQIKYTNDMKKLNEEIAELEQQVDRQREILEEMLQKLKEEIERVSKDLKTQQREADKLEYEGEENEKDLKRSKE